MRKNEKTPAETFVQSFLNDMEKTKKALNNALKALDELAETNQKQNRGTAIFQVRVALDKLQALESMAIAAKESTL